MANRAKIYEIQDNENLTTFQYDENLPSLPLPSLEDTMERYYESLKPLGTENELLEARKVIDNFKNGIGKELHADLVKRAKSHRNWLGNWWEDYGYHLLRVPLYPYTVMIMPFVLECAFVSETPQNALKNLARVSYHTLEFWQLIKNEKIQPLTTNDGKVKYSSKLYKNCFGTARIPGIEKDEIVSYFKTISEGDGATHGIVISRGRIFKFNCLNEDKTLLSPQQLLNIFEIIRARTDYDNLGDCVPVLSCDDRTSWAKNRLYLKELSTKNDEYIRDLDGNILHITLDDNEPKDYSETSVVSVTGDYHSKWADKSSAIISFKNGRMGGLGEHSAYDGTISVSYGLFILLSLAEYPEPDWNDRPGLLPKINELNFVLDEYIKSEITRVLEDCESRRNDVNILHDIFDSYGKNYCKSIGIHPDAYIQMILQLVYYKLHKEYVATYETALMRQYYNGRTETLRSCTTKSVEFIKAAINSKSTKKEIYEKLKIASEHHISLMNEARKGNGIDRHLFGLWCVAYEKGIEIPELYTDEMYLKSGGGGNFVLSTSTLGYTIVNGCVAPMVLDGYGVFYSFTSESIQILTTTYKNSLKTNGGRFNQTFFDTLREMKETINEVLQSNPKL